MIACAATAAGAHAIWFAVGAWALGTIFGLTGAWMIWRDKRRSDERERVQLGVGAATELPSDLYLQVFDSLCGFPGARHL